MATIRLAYNCESKMLTDIAVRSEAYWKYDSNFMENFKNLYKVTEEFIGSNLTYVLEAANHIIGFYALVISDCGTELEYFYIEPENIGKGYGQLLWKHMMDICRSKGIDKIFFVTSPQATGFYTRMGAELCGEVDSIVVKGRRIPKLVYLL